MKIISAVTLDPEGEYYTREAAIRITKEGARAAGYEYPNDEEALDDFMTVHWAVWINVTE